jgi:pilus assembly protein CpaC
MCHVRLGQRLALRRIFIALAACSAASLAYAQQNDHQPIVHKVESPTERLEMIVNSSRILTMDQKIPRAQVNNPDIVQLRPLSPTQVQISAKKAGVTEINLWSESEEVRSVDVIVYGDARELDMLLKSHFPHASLKVYPTANSVVISGNVDKPEQVNQIISMAQDYYPKVINLISVGGVQQILLHIKVMEVSRTKLRSLGFDFSVANGSGDFFVSGISGLINNAANGAAASGTGDTIRFGVVNGGSAFFGFLDAVRRYDLAKILSEPTLVTVSGRPAFFNVGGEIPILVPQSLGTTSIEYKKFGTQLDFVPIVLGNGNIRLEVRPRISELDNSIGVTIDSTTVPGLRVREVETGVEMKAGQTLAIAGLLETRVEASNTGIPWLSDLPYFGVPFRRTTNKDNEIELLIFVTPQLIEAVDCADLPPGGPGLNTVNPGDCDMYFHGYIEVPAPNTQCPPEGCVRPGSESIGPGTNPQPTTGPQARKPAAGATSMTVPPQSTARRVVTMPTATPSGAATSSPTNRYNPSNSPPSRPPTAPADGPGFIGPTGYDVSN